MLASRKTFNATGNNPEGDDQQPHGVDSALHEFHADAQDANHPTSRYRVDSVDSDVYHVVTRRDHVSYSQQAVPLSQRLVQANWVTILVEYGDDERNEVALRLINILSMHARYGYY